MDKMIGYRIKQRRKELHLTQVDIKNMTKISNGNLSEMENGNTLPSASALIALSRALEVSTDWILFGEDSKSDNLSENKISDIEYEYISGFRQLDLNDQEEILAMINFKLNRKESQIKSSVLRNETDIETA